ncbi:AAA family ATPase [Roseobacter fucihabitans]|nr:AAA family ATPase [Roseobacter litoralis]
MAVSRELYLEHSWDMPRGFDDRQQRDPNRFTHAEAGQAKRAKRDTVALKKMFRACWDGADNQQAFAAALADQGYALARGNRRGLVAVDADGKVWSLSRWCGVKPRALAQKITDIEQLPAVDAARALAQALPAQAPRPQTDSKIKVLAALVAQQRGERADLVSQQKLDEATRVAQQPKGLQIAFMKMTGRFDAHVDRCARQAAATQAAAQLAQQDLIDRHLTERRALMPAPAHKPTQQRLEIKAEPTGLTRERLIAHPTLILDELSKTRAAFTRTDTLRALSQWIDDPQTLSKLADGALKSSEAVRLSSDKHPVYTTIDYQKAETQLHQSAAALRADKTSPVMSSHITTALAAKTREMRRAFGWALSAEQEAAVRHVTGPERLANVEGLAGAGKSTMLETATDAWRKKGVTVHGAALAGKAADGLQEASGIQSRTLASLELSWENGQAPIKAGDVLVIDEAGMIGTRQMVRITTKISEIGAKLVLVGDPEQLQPIEAGTPFRDVTQAHGAAKLTEVRRQTQDWQRTATQDLARGDTAKAVDTYRQAGAVSEHLKQDEAIEALAERFAMDARLGRCKQSPHRHPGRPDRSI